VLHILDIFSAACGAARPIWPARCNGFASRIVRRVAVLKSGKAANSE